MVYINSQEISFLAKFFPEKQAEWDIPYPAALFSTDFRIQLRRLMGNNFPAQDFAKRKEPQRLGIFLQEYEPGQPFRCLSIPHLLKRNEYLIRHDFQPGRLRVGIIFHAYKNMEYRSTQSASNKGQVSLAVAATLQCLHESFQHQTEFYKCFDANIVSWLQAIENKLKTWHYTFIITDFLYDTQTHTSSIDKMMEYFYNTKSKFVYFLVVRDIYETPLCKELEDNAYYLENFMSESSNETMLTKFYFSGHDYINNLQKQIDKMSQYSENYKYKYFFITEKDNVESFINNIICYTVGIKS